MRVLLVRPPRIKQAITVSDFMFSEPLGLEMIYGVISEDHEVEIFDMMVEKTGLKERIEEFNPNVVGITSLCIDVKKIIDLSKEIKSINENITTIVGGTQSYLNPKSYYHESIDHIFQYTNRDNLKSFFNLIHLKGLPMALDGILSKEFNYKSTGTKGRNEYLLPDRKSTEKYRHEYSYFGYKPAAIMELGLGCEKCCDFCLRWRIEGRREELISIELTRKDLMEIKEPVIMFIDNDFFSSEKKIQSFIDLIKELDLRKKYIMYGSVKGIIEYEDLIRALVDLGLKAVLVGYETFKDTEMIKYQKKSTINDNYRAARILKELNIDVWASFMAHPDWDIEDFKLFRKYIKTLNPQISSINPLTPFPNLPIYKEYEERLLYKVEDYDKWSFGQVIINPSKMSLRRYYYELLKTNLYVNLFVNKKTEMINRYGIKNIIRLLIGSLGSLRKYIVLMLNANNI